MTDRIRMYGKWYVEEDTVRREKKELEADVAMGIRMHKRAMAENRKLKDFIVFGELMNDFCPSQT